jgi:hypothetical protein
MPSFQLIYISNIHNPFQPKYDYAAVVRRIFCGSELLFRRFTHQATIVLFFCPLLARKKLSECTSTGIYSCMTLCTLSGVVLLARFVLSVGWHSS